MHRSALLLGAGVLAAVSFACVSSVQPRAPQPLLGSRATVTPGVLTSKPYCSDAASFFQRVAVLAPGYDPNVPPGRYVPPILQQPPAGAPANNPYNLRKQIEDDLKSAYTNALPFFKTQLCLLDGVYLNSTGCANGDVNNCTFSGDVFSTSWGFRSHDPEATDNGRRYIAISAGLWQPGQAAWPFHRFADTQLRAVAPWNKAQVQAANPPEPDTSWMTVLAALAHEFGHVRWADVTVPLRVHPPAGGPYDLGPLHSCPGQDFFAGWTYRDDSQLFPKGRWRKFNDRNNEGGPVDHASAPLISQFLSGLSADQKNDLFYNLFLVNQHNDSPWASYLGSLVPDEDFVESYVLGILTGNASGVYLKSLPVTLVYSDNSTKTVDVAKTLDSRTTLQNKISCLP